MPVGIDTTTGFFVALPEGGDFYEATLTGGGGGELEEVERDRKVGVRER